MNGMQAKRWLAWLAVVSLTIAARTAQGGVAEDQFNVAAHHYAHQRWQLSVEEFRTFLSSYGDHAAADTARFYLAESLVQLNRLDEALQAYELLLENDPDEARRQRVAFRRGELAYLSRRDAVADKYLSQFVDDHPNHELVAYAQTYRGQLALRNRRYQKAAELFQRVLSDTPTFPLANECRYGLARSLKLLDRESEAVAIFASLADAADRQWSDAAAIHLARMHFQAGRLPEVLVTLDRFPQRFPKSNRGMEAAYWLGMTHWSQNNWEQADALLSRVLEEGDAGLASAAGYALGESKFRQQQWELARQVFQRVVRRWPESTVADDALYGLVRVADRLGESSGLQQFATELLAHSPDGPFVEPTIKRLLQFHLSGRQYQAVLSLTKEYANHLKQAEQLAYQAFARHGLGDYEAAKSIIDQLELLEVPESLRGPFRLIESDTQFKLGEYAAAVDLLEPMATAGQLSDESTAQLAISLAHLGRWDAAAQWTAKLSVSTELGMSTRQLVAEKALAGGRQDLAVVIYRVLAETADRPEQAGQAMAALAWMAYEGKSLEEAGRWFRELVALYPQHPLAPQAAMMLGRTAQQQSQWEVALGAFRQLIQEYPDSEYLGQALVLAARIHERLQQPEQAISLYRDYLGQFPGESLEEQALYQLAWAYLDVGRTLDAQASFHRIYAEYPQGQFWADATYRLAERAALEREYENAERFANELIELSGQTELVAYAKYMKAQLAVATRRWTAVQQWCERVVREHPTTELAPSARYWLAEAKYQLEEFDDADELLNQLAGQAERASQASWQPMVLLRRAQIAALRKDWDTAFVCLESLSVKHPNFEQQYEADYVWGRYYTSRGQFQEARNAYDRVTQSKAGRGSETAAMAQWMVGETFMMQKMYPEAIRAYHRTIALHDHVAWQAAAALQAGKCHEALEQWQQASDIYDQLIRDFNVKKFQEEAIRRLRVVRQRVSSTS